MQETLRSFLTLLKEKFPLTNQDLVKLMAKCEEVFPSYPLTHLGRWKSGGLPESLFNLKKFIATLPANDSPIDEHCIEIIRKINLERLARLENAPIRSSRQDVQDIFAALMPAVDRMLFQEKTNSLQMKIHSHEYQVDGYGYSPNFKKLFEEFVKKEAGENFPWHDTIKQEEIRTRYQQLLLMREMDYLLTQAPNNFLNLPITQATFDQLVIQFNDPNPTIDKNVTFKQLEKQLEAINTETVINIMTQLCPQISDTPTNQEAIFSTFNWFLKTLPETQRILNLSSQSLSRVPKLIGELSALCELSLAFNHLDSIPSEIGELTKLKELTLQRNNLTSLPSELSNLSALEKLNLAENPLSTLPSQLSDLTSLKTLTLSGTFIEHIPIEFNNANNLGIITTQPLFASSDFPAQNINGQKFSINNTSLEKITTAINDAINSFLKTPVKNTIPKAIFEDFNRIQSIAEPNDQFQAITEWLTKMTADAKTFPKLSSLNEDIAQNLNKVLNKEDGNLSLSKIISVMEIYQPTEITQAESNINKKRNH